MLLMITAVVGCSPVELSPVPSKVILGPGGIVVGAVIVVITTDIATGWLISACLGIKCMPYFFLLQFWTLFF